MAKDGLVVGLDIGTTKVCAVIGERNEKGLLDITGVKKQPSTGLKKGVVVNIEATLRSVRSAIEAAEMMSGLQVSGCWTSVGGSHIDGINSRGVVAVTGRNRETRETREIGPDDIDRVIEAARAVAIPMDRQVLEVIPQSYIVDGQGGIHNPLGMMGVRLEVETHIITCSVTSAQNLIKCVNRAGFKANDLVLKSLASGRAVLTGEEKELGVVLIDLGGGTTDVVVYAGGSPYATITIPVGGTMVTSDISRLKSISIETAEQLKVAAGCCWEELLDKDDDIIIPGGARRPHLSIPRTEMTMIIRDRMEEIYNMVHDKLSRLSLAGHMGGGIVLTGGGALLPGAAELATHVFGGLPVRIGEPLSEGLGGLVSDYRSPLYATALGLILEGKSREDKDNPVPGNIHDREKDPTIIDKVRDWFRREII